jgi:hypothetical protein
VNLQIYSQKTRTNIVPYARIKDVTELCAYAKQRLADKETYLFGKQAKDEQ